MTRVLYVKDNCPHCIKPKQFIKEHDLDIEIVNLSEVPGLVRVLKRQGLKTVPALGQDAKLIEESEVIMGILSKLIEE